MALDKTAIESFVNSIGTANPVALDVDNLGLDRTVSKKFAKMLGKIKSKTATIGDSEYELTSAGAVSMLEMLDSGESLAPAYNADGTLDINSDAAVDTVVVGGSFASNTTVEVDGQPVAQAVTQTITGRSIVLCDATVADKVCLNLKSDGSIAAEGCVLDNRNGGIAKAANKSNSALKVTNCNPTSVSIKDLKIYASNAAGSNMMYNGIEIWGNDATKKIVVENCQFLGKFSNNAVNIYTCGDGANIVVKNCWFDTVSNVLRLSNTKGNKNIKITFENCVIEHWEGENATESAKNDYAGFCICQDYTSTSAEAAETNNLFGGKISIELKNCKGPQGAIALAEGEEYGNRCQTGIGTQLCYVYRDKGGLVAFDAAKYPVISVSYDAEPTVVKGSIPA